MEQVKYEKNIDLVNFFVYYSTMDEFEGKRKPRERNTMNQYFSETLKKLRTEKRLSRQELADKMYVTRSTIARWETGVRLPDAMMITRLSEVLGTDVNLLLAAASQSDECPNIIMVDDRKLILTGGLPILNEVFPNANVTGFTDADEAIEYAKANRVALAFLDIELRDTSGLELCRRLLDIHPRTNVVYLTAYSDYSLDAWRTGASGFMLKPITPEGVREQLENLRYPFWMEVITYNEPAQCYLFFAGRRNHHHYGAWDRVIRFYASRPLEQTVFHRFILTDVSVCRRLLFSPDLLVRSLYGCGVENHLSVGRRVPCDAGFYADDLSAALQRRENKKQRAVPAGDSGSRRVLHFTDSGSVHGRLLLRYAG